MDALIFMIDGGRYAVPLARIAEVVPAVNVRVLPAAPSIVEGVVNVRGEIVPVLAFRERLGHAPAPVRATEYFVIVHTRSRRAIIRSDAAPEIRTLPELAPSLAEPIGRALAGVIALPDGVVVFHDIDQFIDASDDGALEMLLGAGIVAA